MACAGLNEPAPLVSIALSVLHEIREATHEGMLKDFYRTQAYRGTNGNVDHNQGLRLIVLPAVSASGTHIAEGLDVAPAESVQRTENSYVGAPRKILRETGATDLLL